MRKFDKAGVAVVVVIAACPLTKKQMKRFANMCLVAYGGCFFQPLHPQ
jgi:L-aminopeptidase/D-esterase-like protein